MTTAKTPSTHKTEPRTRRGWKKWTLWTILILMLALLCARLYLPIYVKDYVNEQLNTMQGYRGSVEDIGIALYRGAYTIEGLKLTKIDKGIPVPFLTIAHSDISIQWTALFKGKVVSDLHLTRPQINFAVSKSGTTSQTGEGTNWKPLLDNLVPFEINLVELINGKVTYQDFSANPKVDLFITDLDGQVRNLRNVEDRNAPLPSTIAITGDSIGDGKLGIKGRLNILTKYLDMDIDTKLENAKLSAFNDFSRDCCLLDFKKGTMNLYSELAVKDNQVTGYVKPVIINLSVDRIPENTNPLEVAWATVASVLLKVFENQPRDQFATKVPLSGSLDNVQTSIWPTLGGIFRNAFVEAFTKGTDNDISFEKTTKKENAPKVVDDRPITEAPLKNAHPTKR